MQFGIIMSKGLTYIAPSKKLGNDVGELIPSWACELGGWGSAG